MTSDVMPFMSLVTPLPSFMLAVFRHLPGPEGLVAVARALEVTGHGR